MEQAESSGYLPPPEGNPLQRRTFLHIASVALSGGRTNLAPLLALHTKPLSTGYIPEEMTECLSGPPRLPPLTYPLRKLHERTPIEHAQIMANDPRKTQSQLKKRWFKERQETRLVIRSILDAVIASKEADQVAAEET